MRRDWGDERPRSNQLLPQTVRRYADVSVPPTATPTRPLSVSKRALASTYGASNPYATYDNKVHAENLHGNDIDNGVLRRVDGTPIQPLRKTRPRKLALQKQQSIETTPVAYPATPIEDDEPVLDIPSIAGRTWQRQPTPTMPARIQPEPAAIPRRLRQVPTPAVINPHEESELVGVDDNICSICHGAGFLRLDVPVGHPSFGRPIPCRCREELAEQRRRDSLWKMSSLDAFQGMTFDTFNPRIPNTREAWETAQQYAEDPIGWIVLSGPCGSGKTHLAAAIANAVYASGTLVLFSVVPQLLDHLRATFAPTSEATYDALFDRVCQAGLLVLDDLGAEHTTPWAQEKLFQIINHRYMYRLPTVITTNLDLINDLDDRVRSRLTDIGLVRHVHINAGDYRPRNAPSRGTTRPIR
jgi:DNA replication protein DnaC